MSETTKAGTPTPPSLLAAARPDADRFIAHAYSAKAPKDKKLNKAALCRLLNWSHPSWPVAFIPLGLTDDAGGERAAALVEAFRDEDLHVLIMGRGIGKVALPPNVHLAGDNEELFHQALAGADMLIVPGAPTPPFLAQRLAWRYGTVPVVAREHSFSGEADNYEPVMESGNSFLYRDGSIWSLHAALVRAMETYRLPYDWRGIQGKGYELAS